MNSKILKSFSKDVSNAKKELNLSKYLDTQLATVIKTELLLVSKDNLFKTYVIEKNEGGVLKLIDGIKSIVIAEKKKTEYEELIELSKKYRKYVQSILSLFDKKYNISEMSEDEILGVIEIFPESLLILKNQIKEKNLINGVIEKLEDLVKEYSTNVYERKEATSIKVGRVFDYGSVQVYKVSNEHFDCYQKIIALQSILIESQDLLDNENINNPFIYLGYLTSIVQIFKTDYINSSQKVSLAKKIHSLINSNNENAFFGFLNINLPNFNESCYALFEKTLIDFKKTKGNCFKNFVLNNNWEAMGEEYSKLAIFQEIYDLIKAHNEIELKTASNVFLDNFLIILKNINVPISKKEVVKSVFGREDQGELFSSPNDLKNFCSLYSYLLIYSSNSEKTKFIQFFSRNFQNLSSENKINEYEWLLKKYSTSEDTLAIIKLLAIMNELGFNNEIEIVFDLYLNKGVSSKSKNIDFNYILWTLRNNQKIEIYSEYIRKNDNLLNPFWNNLYFENNRLYILENMRKISNFIDGLFGYEEFIFMELGSENWRRHLSNFELRHLRNTLNHLNIEDKRVLDNNVDSEKIKDELVKNNQLNYDKFKNDNLVGVNIEVPIDAYFPNENNYYLITKNITIDNLLYFTGYRFLGEISIIIENEISQYMSQNHSDIEQRINPQEFIKFLREWLHKYTREKELEEKINESNENKMKEELIEELISETEAAKNVKITRKKI